MNISSDQFVLLKQVSNLKRHDLQKSRFSLHQLWGITFLIWSVIALFHYVQFYLEHIAGDSEFLWLPTTIEFVINYYSWVGIAAFVVWLGRTYRLQGGKWLATLTVHIAASVVFAVLHLGIIAMTLKSVKPLALPRYDLLDTFAWAALQLFHFECLMYWVVLGLSYGFEHYVEKQTSQPQPSPYLTRLSLKNNGHIRLLPTSQIDWLEAADNYINIHAGRSSFMLREKMHVIEDRLDPHQFQRIHRSAIVNVGRIKALVRGENGNYMIVLNDGQSLPVSRRRREQIQNSITRHS